MRTIKFEINVTTNHLDCVPALLQELITILERECDRGMIEKTDGDKIEWRVK